MVFLMVFDGFFVTKRDPKKQKKTLHYDSQQSKLWGPCLGIAARRPRSKKLVHLKEEEHMTVEMQWCSARFSSSGSSSGFRIACLLNSRHLRNGYYKVAKSNHIH